MHLRQAMGWKRGNTGEDDLVQEIFLRFSMS